MAPRAYQIYHQVLGYVLFYLRIICIKLRYSILYPLSTLISSCTVNIVEVCSREDMKSHS
jgi:hypothetical protein